MVALCKFFLEALHTWTYDLHHQLAVLSPDGAQALHASELFARLERI